MAPRRVSPSRKGRVHVELRRQALHQKQLLLQFHVGGEDYDVLASRGCWRTGCFLSDGSTGVIIHTALGDDASGGDRSEDACGCLSFVDVGNGHVKIWELPLPPRIQGKIGKHVEDVR